MFLGMNNTRLERKILIILVLKMGFYLPIYHSAKEALFKTFYTQIFTNVDENWSICFKKQLIFCFVWDFWREMTVAPPNCNRHLIFTWRWIQRGFHHKYFAGLYVVNNLVNMIPITKVDQNRNLKYVTWREILQLTTHQWIQGYLTKAFVDFLWKYLS